MVLSLLKLVFDKYYSKSSILLYEYIWEFIFLHIIYWKIVNKAIQF